MRFEDTSLPGVQLIHLDLLSDSRGHFARSWCAREFASHGIDVTMVQGNLSRNHRRGTLRGLHFQRTPSREGKLVRCVRGRIFDVVLDLRESSTGFLTHYAVELAGDSNSMLYIPPGVAHGFQTLEDDTEVSYLMSDYYAPEYADGVRWNDPAFGIEWPIQPPPAMSERDGQYPDFRPDDTRIFR